MKLGFIIPDYSCEKRAALLPEHILGFKNEIYIESGFGKFLGISDEEYEKKGCKILKRDEIFEKCEAVFSLKLIQKGDYEKIRKGQVIVGWVHIHASGKEFCEKMENEKDCIIIDLENTHPKVCSRGREIDNIYLERNFVWKNSYIAGYASTIHGFTSFGLIPDSSIKVAVLSAGNVAQGALAAVNKLGADARLYYRSTMKEFKKNMGQYDVIINGIELQGTDEPIVSNEDLKHLKNGCFIIDAAADTGRTIEASRHTTITDPIYEYENVFIYAVSNSPSIFYKTSSYEISKAFSKNVYKRDIKDFVDLL